MDAITIDELQSSLILHEKKLHNSSGVDQALKVTTDDKTWSSGHRRGYYREQGRGGQAFNKATVECYKCNNLDCSNINVQNRIKKQIMQK